MAKTIYQGWRVSRDGGYFWEGTVSNNQRLQSTSKPPRGGPAIGCFDITQPFLPEEVDMLGETHGVDVFVTEHETEALLLGPDGRALQYEEPQPVGFDLRPRE